MELVGIRATIRTRWSEGERREGTVDPDMLKGKRAQARRTVERPESTKARKVCREQRKQTHRWRGSTGEAERSSGDIRLDFRKPKTLGSVEKGGRGASKP
jgi:hypothetical protein